MSQAEDYLDGLLNSINKAKSDAEQVQENAVKKQQEFVENRKAVAPDDDFFAATGIDVQQTKTRSSHPYLRKVLSEDDFMRKFEEELTVEDVDSFITAFEQEIDDEERLFEETGEAPAHEDIVDKLINDIDNVVSDATKELDEPEPEPEPEPVPEPVAEEIPEEEGISLDDFENLEGVELANSDGDAGGEGSLLDGDLKLPDDEDIDLSEFIEESDEGEENSSDGDDDIGLSLDDATDLSAEEEPLDESMKEFMPDDMDALDEAQYGDGEEPDLSGEGELDLDNILEGDGTDEDLLDIQSLLNGDEEGAPATADIDESAEAAPAAEAADDGKKGKKKKEKKEKKKKEKGEKKPNPFLQKLALIIFGAPDEDEIAEMEAEAAAAAARTVEITYDEDGNPIIPEGGGVPEDPKEKKKREKEEKKAAKEAAKKEKEAAKKEKDAAKKDKPKKEPKPKKPKKEKQPDTSPKIPISIIATFLVLSISIIGVVVVGMKFTGLQRHMSQAREFYDQGNYIAAYEKINGYDLNDEKVALLRNQARTLADLQQCQDEYVAFMNAKMYNYALDSLLKGIGRYEKYKDDAAEYGISEEYDAFGSQIIYELQDSFGLSVEDAMAIYKQPNRHYYTIELRKVLRKLGLPDT